jgi:hypothetical protein
MFLKVFMIEDGAVLITSQLAESVHIQLPHKGEEVCMLEVPRKNLVGQP